MKGTYAHAGSRKGKGNTKRQPGFSGRFVASGTIVVWALFVMGIAYGATPGEIPPIELLWPKDGQKTSVREMPLVWRGPYCGDQPALHFDGTSSYVRIPNALSLNSKSFSLAVRFKVEKLRAQGLVDKITRRWTRGWRLFMTRRGTVEFDASREVANVHTPKLETREWYYVVATHDAKAKTAKMYLNGRLMQKAIDVDMQNTFPDRLELGSRETNRLSGSINAFRMYGRALSAAEAADLASGKEISDADLVIHYDLRQGAGQILEDQSEHDNDGILGGERAVEASDPVWGSPELDHYEVILDGQMVGTTKGAQLYATDLDEGDHEWYVTGVTHDGERIRSQTTNAFGILPVDYATRDASRILVAGDLHMGGWHNWDTGPVELGQHINALDEKYPLDFMFEAGDFCLDFPDNVEHSDFLLMTKSSDVPFFHVMGDHEGWQWEKFVDRAATPPRSYYYLHDGILHIFLNSPVSQWLAGTYTQELLYFVKYLVEHKYPDKTTFVYSHFGVYGYSPTWEHIGEKIGEVHENKFANYQNTDFWDTLFANNPQIKVFFNGHTHNNIYKETSWVRRNGVLFVDLETVSPAGYHGIGSGGPTSDFPLVTTTAERIHLVPYNLDREQIEPFPQRGEPGVMQEWLLEGETSYDPSVPDEFGAMRVLLDGRRILNFNHIVGHERKIEIVRPDSTNILPDPDFTNTRGYKGHPRVHQRAGCDISPFWMVGGGFDHTNVTQEGDIITFEDAKGWVGTHGIDGLKNTKWIHTHGDYPPAAEGIELELTARIHSDRAIQGGLKTRIYFQIDEWNRDPKKLPRDDDGHYTALFTDVKVAEETSDLSEGWGTYRFTARAPRDVDNPTAEVPRLRALPEFEFAQKGTYRLDWVRLRPVPRGGTTKLVNPGLTLFGKTFRADGELGAWESVVLDAPVQAPKEEVQMHADGDGMGLVIFRVTDPKIKTWGRPVQFGPGTIRAGETRVRNPNYWDMPTDIYMHSLDGTFTVGDEWTRNVQRAPKLVMKDIPDAAPLGMWDLAAECDSAVEVRHLRVHYEPLRISWQARGNDRVTWIVGNLREGRAYTIVRDGSQLAVRTADERGEVQFSCSLGGTALLSVTQQAAR